MRTEKVHMSSCCYLIFVLLNTGRRIAINNQGTTRLNYPFVVRKQWQIQPNQYTLKFANEVRVSKSIR